MMKYRYSDQCFDIGIEELINNKKHHTQPFGPHGVNDDGTVMPFDEQMAIVTHYIQNLPTGHETTFSRGVGIYEDLVAYRYGHEALDSGMACDSCGDMFASLYEQANIPFRPPRIPRFTFIDLFAGIGGFRIAMQSQGGKCVFSSEFNEAAQKTYYKNYGEVPFGDITKQEIKRYIPKTFDVLCAGFPCQAFSIAGYRKGFDDTRGTLFFDVADILRCHRPKVAFLENVKNLETHDGGRTFEVICDTLRELRYIPYFKVLNACEYADIPQNRERIIIVAFNEDLVANHADFRFPEPLPLEHTIHDCIEPGMKAEKYYYRENHIYYPKLSECMTSRDTVYQWRRIYVRENKSRLCPTLTANMGSGGHNVPLILTDDGIRKLTPKECLNFMGYPENYSFPRSIAESKMYMQAGNSVVVPMMKRVAEEISKIIL